MKSARRVRKPATRGNAWKRQASQLQYGLPINVRAAGVTEEDRRDLTCRAVAMQIDSLDEATRSVGCTIVTENIVTVIDFGEFRAIDEVLLISGFSAAPHVNLLDNHRRSNDDVFGSLVDFKPTARGIQCRLVFADMSSLAAGGDPEALRTERAWLRAKQGHQRNVSAGYTVQESTTIPPHKSQSVAGRVWTAGDRPLRISTKWLLREGSLTPISADHNALTRSQSQEIESVNTKLRNYLITLGLRAESSEAEAWAFYGSLTVPAERAEAQRLNERTMPARVAPTAPGTEGEATPTAPAAPATPAATQAAATATRSQATGAEGSSTATEVTPSIPAGLDLRGVTDPTAIAQRVLQHDRDRQRSLRELFGDSEPALLVAYLDDTTMNAERAAPELARRLRAQLGLAVAPNGSGTGSPAIHSRGFESDVTLEALQGALIMRSAINRDLARLEHESFATPEALAMSIPSFLRADINDDVRQRHMDNANRLRGISMIRLCEYALRLRGHMVPHDEGQIVERAFATNSLEPIFTTNVNARMLASYVDGPDTTEAWTASEEVGNFKKNERPTMGKVGALTKHGRGGNADMTDNDATMEEYRLARYSQQWAIDEMDVIDDQVGASNSITPEDMGLAAKQLCPDLVYSILLANPTLLATGRAVFNSTDGNTGAGALSIPNVEQAEAWFGDQRIRTRPLNLMLRVLLVPRQLRWLAARITGSAEVRDNEVANGRYSVTNPINGENLVVVFDSRIGAGGVTDPGTGVHYAGSNTGWYAMTKPGEQGAKTVIVGYRRGTGRSPVVRSSLLQQGCWGYHYDIKHDIGAAPLDWRGMKRYTG